MQPRGLPDNQLSDAEMGQDLWYAAGLRFACMQCGVCCSGAPGYVWVTQDEIARIAAFLGREGKGLTRRHLRQVGIRYSLTEDEKAGKCCFLEMRNGKPCCSIYPVRPVQCRTWPFWDTNLCSIDGWNRAALQCPGINRGRHHDREHIERRRQARRIEDLLP
jgi:uncharacterized protein